MTKALVDAGIDESDSRYWPPRGKSSGLHVLLCCALLQASPAASEDGNLEVSKLLLAGYHQPALRRVNAMLTSNPNDPQARFLKGLILAKQGKGKDAIATFQKLAEEYPEFPEPHYQLAIIYAAHGQTDKSRAALERSIRSYPLAQHPPVFETPRSRSGP